MGFEFQELCDEVSQPHGPEQCVQTKLARKSLVGLIVKFLPIDAFFVARAPPQATAEAGQERGPKRLHVQELECWFGG